MDGDRFVLRAITDEITYEMNRLSQQEYADVYASGVRSQSGQ
jgi:1-acyl-sn-glycerol-3-phosphate acyltransferase